MNVNSHYTMIELIKERLTIQEAAERYTNIDLSRTKGRGNTISTRCPFHSDRSPSFTMWLDTNKWRCHAGCGSGDVIDLLMVSQQVEVKEAMNLLANDLGLDEPLDSHKINELQAKVSKKEAERQLVRDYEKDFDEVFHRLIRLERMLHRQLDNIKTPADLERIGELYHVIPMIEYLLDCMIEPEFETQVQTFIQASEVLTKWGL